MRYGSWKLRQPHVTSILYLGSRLGSTLADVRVSFWAVRFSSPVQVGFSQFLKCKTSQSRFLLGLKNPKRTIRHEQRFCVVVGPIGLVSLLAAKAMGASKVVITGNIRILMLHLRPSRNKDMVSMTWT